MSRDLTKPAASGPGVLPNIPGMEDLFKMVGLTPGGAPELKMEAAKPIAEAIDKADAEIKRAFVRFYNTDDGKVVLDWMLDQTLRRSCWHPGNTPTLDECTVFGLQRGGQNSIAVSFMKMIDDGRKLPPPSAKRTKKTK